MKIAIDISQIVYGTGVSTYTQNLVTGLLKLDQKNEYVLFGGSARRYSTLRSFCNKLRGNFTTKLVSVPPTVADLMWNKMHIVPIESLTGKIDVFHSSDWTEPPSRAYKVTTVHDLTPLKYPQFTAQKVVEVHKRKLKWVQKESKRIIVPSVATQNDLAEFGFNKERIRVIPEAVSDEYHPATHDAIVAVRQKYNLEGDFVLAIGANPRKNTNRIIQAMKRVNKETNIKCIVIGQPLAISTQQPSYINFVGFIPREDIISLYSAARCLVYPSIYEGFGLPILEAFACGCPVVTSNNSSLVEIVDEAGVKVDPYDINAISAGILKVIRKRGVYQRKGFDRVKQYNWENVAVQTLAVYNESLSGI
jgi:glycosyltransferase involved in cell wall biosynthesis